MRHLWWRGRDVDSGKVPVFPLASELHSISGPDFEVFTISVSEETIARVCEQCELPLPSARLRPETFRPPPDQLDRLRQQLRRLADPTGGDAPVEARQVAENLVASWLGPMITSVRRPSLRTRDRAMKRCLERLEQPDWTALSPAQLCEIACVGERTLQYAFRERFGLTPAAFLKARRLAVVHQRLLQAELGNDTVGDAAASLGFWHLSHFAADYRHAFGEMPWETLKRSRCAGTPESRRRVRRSVLKTTDVRFPTSTCRSIATRRQAATGTEPPMRSTTPPSALGRERPLTPAYSSGQCQKSGHCT